MDYVNHLVKHFATHADMNNAVPMKRYMKNRFEFFGIKSPERKTLTRAFFMEYGLPDAKDTNEFLRHIWEQPQRELHYVGLDILEKLVKRQKIADVDLLEFLITTKSWWDTVDWLATRIVGVHLKHYPDEINSIHKDWMDSKNMWLQRVCILFQLKYKNETDVPLLFDTIKRLSDSDEFFIQKAIGWALREYSKTDPDIVLRFVDTHDLKPLSRREALKVIKRQVR